MEEKAEGSGPPPDRRRLWRKRLARLARPTRFAVILVILALILEYLVIPELAGASRDLYLLGRVSAWWVAAGVTLQTASLFGYAVLTRVLLPPRPPAGAVEAVPH